MRGIIEQSGEKLDYYNYLNKNNSVDKQILKLVKKDRLSISFVLLAD